MITLALECIQVSLSSLASVVMDVRITLNSLVGQGRICNCQYTRLYLS